MNWVPRGSIGTEDPTIADSDVIERIVGVLFACVPLLTCGFNDGIQTAGSADVHS